MTCEEVHRIAETSTDADVLRQLFKSREQGDTFLFLHRSLIKNPHTPDDVILAISKEEPFGLQIVLTDTSFSEQMYRDILAIQDPAHIIVHLMMGFPTPAILGILSEHADSLVRYIVAERKDTPSKNLLALSQDPEESVRNRATQTIAEGGVYLMDLLDFAITTP